MKPLRLGVLVVLCISTVGCTEGCRRQDDTKGPSKSDKAFVVAIPTYPGFAIPYLAKEKGYFGDLKVELRRIDDAAAINAGLIRGDIDSCFTSVDSFVLAASQGVKAQAVLMTDESQGADGIVVKSEIKELSDLRGKKVAANLGWPGHFFLLYNLDKAGIPFDEVPITNLDAEQAGAAFVSGNLDAAVTWEPWLSKATSEANGKILISTKSKPGVIVDVMLVREETLAQRPEAVQAFVNAYYKALNDYETDKSAGNAVMAGALGLKAAEFEEMTGGFRFIPADEARQMLNPSDGVVANLFSEATDIWVKAKVIDKKIPHEKRAVNRFVEASLKKE